MKLKKKKSRNKKFTAKALLIAASSIPGISCTSLCLAEGAVPGNELRFKMYSYQDRQQGQDRMTVYAPMAWFRSAISPKTEIQGGYVLDSVSGASPLYHDTLSGASGKEISDRRQAQDISLTQYFESFSLTAAVSHSEEDDYNAWGKSLEARIWTDDHNTIFNFGISRSDDNVSSTNDPLLDENRFTNGVGAGVTQVLDPLSMLQTNFTISSSDGFLTDPYKTLDYRPTSRDQFAWLTRYVTYYPDYEGALHLDYRFFADSWSVVAHTWEASWYQELGSSWSVIPHVRFYSQSKSQFYENDFPPEEPGASFYTADQRLSGFGSVTTGVSLEYSVTENTSLSAQMDFMQQRGAWKIGAPGSPNLDPMTAMIFGVGFVTKF